MSVWRAVVLVPVLLAVALTALLGAPLARAASAGTLDPAFGTGGRLSTIEGLPSGFETGFHQTAVAPDGDIYVAAEETHEDPRSPKVELRRYLPGGTIDPSFGSGGAIVVPNAPETRFAASTLLVDAEGRPYLVGTTYFETPIAGNFFWPATATVIRYTTAGQPDPSFGSGGYAGFDFGLEEQAPGVRPAVSASDAVIDPQGRVTFLASQGLTWTTGPETSSSENRQRLLARLSPDGTLDPSFGEGGTVSVLGQTRILQLAARESGAVDLLMWGKKKESRGFKIVRLAPSGAPEESFGRGGTQLFPRRELPTAWAPAADGSNFILQRTWPDRERDHSFTKVLEFNAAGRAVKRFGNGGLVSVELNGHANLRGITADGQGGAYLLGTFPVRRPRGTWATARHLLLVIHLLANGKPDQAFGDGGRVRIGCGTDCGALTAQITAAGLLIEALTAPSVAAGTNLFLACLALG